MSNCTEVGNTPNVNVANTPNVNVATMPSVSITGTPTVSLAAGGSFAVTDPLDGQSDPTLLVRTEGAQVYEDECDTSLPVKTPQIVFSTLFPPANVSLFRSSMPT